MADRHRHRRLDPPARRGHRHGRGQADLRRHLPVRADRLLVLAWTRPGPCARTVLDAALLHEAIAGHDPMRLHAHPTAGAAGGRGGPAGRRRRPDRPEARRGPRARRRGLPSRASPRRFARRSRRWSSWAPRCVEVSCPHFDVRAAGLLPDRAERGVVEPGPLRRRPVRAAGRRRRAAVLEEVMSLTREAGFGPEVKRRIILGTYALSSRLLRRLLRPGAEGAHADHPRLRRRVRAGRRAGRADHADRGVPARVARVDDPWPMYLADLCTIPANLSGVPAISVPAGCPRACRSACR